MVVYNGRVLAEVNDSNTVRSENDLTVDKPIVARDSYYVNAATYDTSASVKLLTYDENGVLSFLSLEPNKRIGTDENGDIGSVL